MLARDAFTIAFNVFMTAVLHKTMHWTWVNYMSNVQRWPEKMVACQVWKISEVCQQMAKCCFDRSSLHSLFYIVLALSISTLQALCVTLSPPLHFNSMSCIHSWTSDHPAVHHSQMILIILRKKMAQFFISFAIITDSPTKLSIPIQSKGANFKHWWN